MKYRERLTTANAISTVHIGDGELDAVELIAVLIFILILFYLFTRD
jgi:hypothetical protein